ncbi:MAG: hypothetical protein Q9220_004068 [cf. Caloplaca sp. 1 TL-2023]
MAETPNERDLRHVIKTRFKRRASSTKLLLSLHGILAEQPRLPKDLLLEILLEEGRRGRSVDPRLSTYLETLLDSGDIYAFSLLFATHKQLSKDGGNTQTSPLDIGDSMPPSLPTVVLQLLTRKLANGLVQEDAQLRALFESLLPWMKDFPSSITVGLLVSASLGCSKAQEYVPSWNAKKFKARFGEGLTHLINNFSQTNIQLASALSYWQKLYHLHDDIPTESMELLNGVDMGTLCFQESVLDNEPVNSRAGLYIFLNATLCERPLFDDLAVMNYLNVRYKTITLLRSFLVNKLPVFLSNYAAILFPPLSIEACISQALSRVDPAAFPSFSQMFDLLGKNGILSEARQEFLFACALHQLIPEGNIESLLGDVPMQSLPASGRYVKDGLVAQCTTNSARIEEIVGELEKMEGNAGEIVGALVEIITTLCSNNDTLTLKSVCNCLVRRAATLDIIALFYPPQTLLQPICQLLNDWQEQEDQVENQPVYDEFGSLLLLVSIIKHRFDLSPLDLGIPDDSTFIIQYYRSACMSRSVDSLDEHDSELLGGWVRGLFETEGINDELMSTCKPAEFHLLVATLLDQSIKACQSRVLALETLKGGLECRLLTFALWETKESSASINALMPALHTLLKPPSISSDSAVMHSAILDIVAEPLDQALTHAQLQHNRRVDIAPLQEKLRSHMQKHRQKASALSELETWAATPNKGLLTALSTTINALMSWNIASLNSAGMSAPNYTHRLLLRTQQILGAKATIKFLIDEIMAQVDSAGEENVDLIMDIIVTLIVAPQPSTSSPASFPAYQGRLTLRDVLRNISTEANELCKTDTARARIIVRLHRRVEAFAPVPPNAMADIQHENMDGTLDSTGQGMMLRDAEGMPATDIDDVLAHTEGQIASGDFGLGVGGDGDGMGQDFMSLG